MSYNVKAHSSKFGPFDNRETAEALVAHLALAHVNTGLIGDITVEEASSQEGFYAEGILSAAEPHAVHVHLHQEPTTGHPCANTAPIGDQADRAWKERTGP